MGEMIIRLLMLAAILASFEVAYAQCRAIDKSIGRLSNHKDQCSRKANPGESWLAAMG
jgi:hypothetical protein